MKFHFNAVIHLPSQLQLEIKICYWFQLKLPDLIGNLKLNSS